MGAVDGVHEQHRDTPDVIAMQVRQVYGRDPLGIAPEPFQRGERGGSEIDGTGRASVLQEPGGIAPPRARKGIRAAENDDPRGHLPSSPARSRTGDTAVATAS